MSTVQKRQNPAAPEKKNILMIVPNPTTHKGLPAGFYAEELTRPFFHFVRTGHNVDVVSPKGGKVTYDPMSDPEHEHTQAPYDFITLGFNQHPEYGKLLENTPSIGDINKDDYDAVFVVGGGAPLITFKDDKELHQLVADFYEDGKVVATICHGACVLLWSTLSNGELLVKGKTWTGFSDAEENLANQSVGMTIFDETIESEAGKIPETTFEAGSPFQPFAIRDGRLISGQQQLSSLLVAELVTEALAEENA